MNIEETTSDVFVDIRGSQPVSSISMRYNTIHKLAQFYLFFYYFAFFATKVNILCR